MGTPIWTSRCRHRHHHHSQRTMNTKGFWSARLNGRNGPANYLNKLVAYILYAAYNRSDWCGMAFCWSFTYIFYLNRNGKIVFSIFHIKIMMIVVVSFFFSFFSLILACSFALSRLHSTITTSITFSNWNWRSTTIPVGNGRCVICSNN